MVTNTNSHFPRGKWGGGHITVSWLQWSSLVLFSLVYLLTYLRRWSVEKEWMTIVTQILLSELLEGKCWRCRPKLWHNDTYGGWLLLKEETTAKTEGKRRKRKQRGHCNTNCVILLLPIMTNPLLVDSAMKKAASESDAW